MKYITCKLTKTYSFFWKGNTKLEKPILKVQGPLLEQLIIVNKQD